jgi:hypothetical protein
MVEIEKKPKKSREKRTRRAAAKTQVVQESSLPQKSAREIREEEIQKSKDRGFDSRHSDSSYPRGNQI